MRRFLVAALLAASATAQAEDAPPPMVMPPTVPPPTVPPPLPPIPPPIVAPVPYLPPPYVLVSPPRVKKGGFLVDLDLGGVYRYGLRETFGAAAAHVLLGGLSHSESFFAGGTLDIEVGQSRAGLTHGAVLWGADFGGVAGRLRFGLGPRFGFLAIGRATSRDEAMAGLVLGLEGHLGVDLWRSGGTAVGLVARGGYQALPESRGAYSHGARASLSLGFRFK